MYSCPSQLLTMYTTPGVSHSTHLDPSCLRHGGRVPEEEELAAVADDQARAVGRYAPPLPRLGSAQVVRF